jgi:hypothetical protein
MKASSARSRLPSRVLLPVSRRSRRQDSDSPSQSAEEPIVARLPAVGGPVSVAWREGTLTRAEELEALCAWAASQHAEKNHEALSMAIKHHLEAARQAAAAKELDPHKRFRIFRNGPLIERARSNIDAAEAHLLNLAEPEYVLGQMPCLLRHVRSHLPPEDPRRQEFEAIAARLGIKDPGHPQLNQARVPSRTEKLSIVKEEQGRIVAIVRGASSAALREHVRLRSFRNVVLVTTTLLAVLAIGVAITGFSRPTLIPLCFAPEEAGKAVVVCPTAQSEPFIPEGEQPQSGVQMRDIDEVVKETASRQDLIVVELVGLTAAAIATAAAIRSIKGSSERYGLPVSLAALKLPTGAITAFLGLLLMRGQFVPGLTALDTSAQVLAWALIFGYAQQLFTRLVDQQGQSVLESVRPTDRTHSISSPS